VSCSCTVSIEGRLFGSVQTANRHIVLVNIDRERWMVFVYVHTHTHTHSHTLTHSHTHTHIYIYIHICRQKGGSRDRTREWRTWFTAQRNQVIHTMQIVCCSCGQFYWVPHISFVNSLMQLLSFHILSHNDSEL
jgi:hypothetical protein